MLWITKKDSIEKYTPSFDERIILLGQMRCDNTLNLLPRSDVAGMLGISEDQLDADLKYISEILNSYICHWKP